MNPDDFPQPVQNRLYSAGLISYEPTPPPERKEGLTAKLRHTINSATRRVQTARPERSSTPNLSTLTPQCQSLILEAVGAIQTEDSKQVMSILDESRDMFRLSMSTFKDDQDEYHKQLDAVAQTRDTLMERRKENAIPLAMFMRQKRDVEGLADLRPNSGMNPTYQAYFEALLVPNEKQEQHPSDRAAVIKYIRRRERRRRADENRENHVITEDALERQTTEILGKMDGMDIKLEHERRRQSNIIRFKMDERKIKSKTMLEATEIIDQAHEANLARERLEQKHREKIEARLDEVRHRPPTNIIHVQARDDDDAPPLDDQQRSATHNSIQLLNQNDTHKPMSSATPIYGEENPREIATIQI